MLISYTRPAIVWSIVNNNPTHAIVTAPNGLAALSNGRPADPTLLLWTQTGASAIGDSFSLVATLSTPITPRCAAMLMSNIASAIPPGVKIVTTATLAAANVPLGGNSAIQRAQLLANGSAASWFAFPPGVGNVDTFVYTIFNDRNGATWLPSSAATLFTVGEGWVGKGSDFAIDLSADDELDGGLLQRASHNNQAWPLQVQPFRVLTVRLVPMQESAVIGPAAANQDDFQTVRNAIATSPCCVLIPAYLKPGNLNALTGVPNVTSGTISVPRLHRSAQLGVIDAAIKISGNGETFFVAPITHGETPP